VDISASGAGKRIASRKGVGVESTLPSEQQCEVRLVSETGGYQLTTTWNIYCIDREGLLKLNESVLPTAFKYQAKFEKR